MNLPSPVHDGALLNKISEPQQILLRHRPPFTCICGTVLYCHPSHRALESSSQFFSCILEDFALNGARRTCKNDLCCVDQNSDLKACLVHPGCKIKEGTIFTFA